MEHNTTKELKTKLKTKNQMKKVILILALTISSFNIYSQNVQVDKDGNYISIKNSRKGKSVATDKFLGRMLQRYKRDAIDILEPAYP